MSASADAGDAPFVLAIAGTDHHPFDRLTAWMDAWAAASPGSRVLVQYGTGRAPGTAEGRDYLSAPDLAALLGSADLVVCHGGPGTIMAAREAGHVPIVIARRPDLGEHVDDHQVRFTARMAGLGKVHPASDQDELARLLASGLAGDPGFHVDASGSDAEQAATAAARFGELVDRLVAGGEMRGSDA